MSLNMSDGSVFRAEAVEHHLREPGSRGVIKASPPWTWFVLAASACLILLAALFLCLTTIDVPFRVDGTVQLSKGQTHIVAYIHGPSIALQQGQRVHIEPRDYPRAGVASLGGHITHLVSLGRPAANGSAQALMRIDIGLEPPALASLHDGAPVRVLLASHKTHLITLIRNSLL